MAHNRDQVEDLRVRRTRMLLQKALIELTVEKGFAAITVRDISDRAMVNRATFYRHYLDKYDLLNQYMEELYDLTESQEPEPVQTPAGHPTSGPESLPAGMVRLLEHVRMNSGFFRVMLGKDGDPAFTDSVRQYIERRMRRLLPARSGQTDAGRPPVDLCLSYISHAGIGALVWWLENDIPCSAAQLAAWIYTFSQADTAVTQS